MNEQQRLLRERVIPGFDRLPPFGYELIVQARDTRSEDRFDMLSDGVEEVIDVPPYEHVFSALGYPNKYERTPLPEPIWVGSPHFEPVRWAATVLHCDEPKPPPYARRRHSDMAKEASDLLGEWCLRFGVSRRSLQSPPFAEDSRWLSVLADLILHWGDDTSCFPGMRFRAGPFWCVDFGELIALDSERLSELESADAWWLEIPDLSRASVYAAEILTASAEARRATEPRPAFGPDGGWTDEAKREIQSAIRDEQQREAFRRSLYVLLWGGLWPELRRRLSDEALNNISCRTPDTAMNEAAARWEKLTGCKPPWEEGQWRNLGRIVGVPLDGEPTADQVRHELVPAIQRHHTEPAAQTDGPEDDFRSAKWFNDRTRGKLYGNRLRQMALRQSARGEEPIGYQPKDGGRWVYSVEAVKRKWPEEAPFLDDNAARRPRPRPQRTQAMHTKAHKSTQRG